MGSWGPKEVYKTSWNLNDQNPSPLQSSYKKYSDFTSFIFGAYLHQLLWAGASGQWYMAIFTWNFAALDLYIWATFKTQTWHSIILIG